MDADLLKRLERLGPVRDIERVLTGSPTGIILSLLPGGATPKTIDATRSLARRGLSLFQAKQAVEAVLEDNDVSVSLTLPIVEDGPALIDELAAAGFWSVRIGHHQRARS